MWFPVERRWLLGFGRLVGGGMDGLVLGVGLGGGRFGDEGLFLLVAFEFGEVRGRKRALVVVVGDAWYLDVFLFVRTRRIVALALEMRIRLEPALVLRV
jgi:hypothetical protein